MDIHHVQPVKEIFPEGAASDLSLNIRVGGGKEPDVNPDGGGVADPVELLLLEKTEEGLLQVHGDIPHFIQEEGAAVGRLQEPLPVLGGAGEGPLLAAEQLGFQQLVGQGAAVFHHERLGAAR